MDIDDECSIQYNKRVKKIKKMVGDSVSVKKQIAQTYQLSELHEIIENNHQKNSQTLLLGGERTGFFVTEDSRQYISTQQQYKKDYRYAYIDARGQFDSVQVRYIKKYSASEVQYSRITAEFRNAHDIAASFRSALKLDLSPIRTWQVSLAGAVLFGMISMSMIYNNFGQSAFAQDGEAVVDNIDVKTVELVLDTTVDIQDEKADKKQEESKKEKEVKAEGKITDKKDVEEKVIRDDVAVVGEKLDVQPALVDSIHKKEVQEETKKEVTKEARSVDSVLKGRDEQKDSFTDAKGEYSLAYEAYEMVDGYPIEEMLPYILKQDPEVAKYLIAMAKQESQWGQRVPVLNGQDCYNYWGYRSQRKLMGSGGHTCFNSRKDAVETVGKRIHELIYKYDRKTADRLIVWKCGSSCDGHSQEGVNRWINVVDTYYNRLSQS